MGKGGRQAQKFSREEVSRHDKHDDKWIVIGGEVYNITQWSKKHPGGSRVISHYAGQDATDAFTAFHNNKEEIQKYLKAIHVGTLAETDLTTQNTDIEQDFRKLRETAEKMDLFKPSYTFYALHLAHIIVMEVLAYLTLYYYGTGWIPFIVSVCLYSTVQAQIGWLQHDFGHLSVFKTSWLDHMFHFFTIGFIKGASPSWWNHMHYQHHAKPNVMNKDPDVRMEKLFVVGEKMPVKVAKNKSSVPYNWQHKYFFIVGPPLLFPIYFQYMLFRHIFTRKLWKDFIVVMAFYVKFFVLYTHMLGLGWAFVYYEIMRILESHWFTWVSQSNHIPMHIDEDTAQPWVKLQMHATCDIEKSFFNDWFTGHLNFQIEHHLFPTMPRHNLYKIQPLVRSLCKKHGIDYQIKSLSQSFKDIVKTLKHSGEIWLSAYEAYHLS